MSDTDLKAYTRKAKELEAAIHTQKQLMKRHEVVLEEKRPKIPQKARMNPPQKPIESKYHIEVQGKTDNTTVIGMAVATIIGLVLASIAPILGVLLALICGVSLIIVLLQNASANNNASKRNRELAIQYEKDMVTYEKKLKSFQQAKKEYEINYQNNLKYYHEQAEQYDGNTNSIMEKHTSSLAALENALVALYDQDIIFPKYRNLVAIATINEYLESGRCYELEGPNGAYNLYEEELRQNIIIGQLSTVISNMEQIRGNQYILYEELRKSNQQIDEIIYELKDLNNTAKLNAYFNGITALVAVSPTVSYGVII